MTSNELYDLAEENNIEIYDFPLQGRKALSMLTDGGCAIAMDTYRMSARDERIALAHEMGHCMTYAFYTTQSSNKAHCECIAEKWSVRHIVPEDELREAVSDGRSLWELAEIFEVNEETIIEAINLYYHNHL